MKRAEDHYSLAFDLIERRLIDEAIKELREAVKIYPEYAEARLMLGFQLMNRNRAEAARELYEGIKVNPELFDKFIISLESEIQNSLPEDEEAIKILNLLKLMANITKCISSDKETLAIDKSGKDFYKEIKHDDTDSSERKNINNNLAAEIIAKALNVATNGRIEKINYMPPETGTMTAEKIQEIGITKESLLGAFRSDPRVISAECKNGEFHIKTVAGKLSFKFKFEDEKTSGSA